MKTTAPNLTKFGTLKTCLFTWLGVLAFGGTGLAQDEKVRGEDFVRAPAIADGLCVSNAFQNDMVLQRDKPIKVWGWASSKETVTVSFLDQNVEATANDERLWEATLNPVAAQKTPQVLTIKGKTEVIELKNILVGDVWVLGGQSNMEFGIEKVNEGMLEIASANFPQIRLLTIPRGKGFDSVKSFERLDEWSDWSSRHFSKGDWEVCTPESVVEFSAIGYVFGRRLAMASDVPIGLIDASVGGTTVETWTPESVVESVEGKETQDMVQDWAEKIAEFDSKADLENRIANYERNKKNREKQGNPLPADSKPPSDLRPGPIADKNRPGYCYESMIKPLEGLSIKGALFHQGFNNCFSGSAGARMYYQVFGKMITSWRSAFGDEQLPFCIISLCTAGDPQTAENFSKQMYNVGPFIREAQHQTYRDFQEKGDEQIGFVSSFDFRISWYHPQIKVPVGERAAKWALVTQYDLLQGRDANQNWQPPTIDEMKVDDGKIVLTLSTDIKMADDSLGKMVGFAIAGEDREFHPAEIEYFADGVDNRNRPKFKKNKLVLSSPMVAEPKHYRYAWGRNPLANLVNRNLIPIATQRSDDWILEETPASIAPPEGMDEGSVSRWLGNQQQRVLENLDKERRLREAEALVEELKPQVEKAAEEEAKKKAESVVVKPVKHLIDTHIHLYDTTRDVEITWPPEDDDVLFKPHLPAEYSKIAKAAGVSGVVIVEASNNLEDNQWVLDLVKSEADFYIGLVGNVDVYRDDFEDRVKELKQDKRFVGVRARRKGVIDFSDKRVLENLGVLAKHNLTLDYLTNGGGIQGIEKIDAVARAIPELQIVVNHCLGYDFDGKAPGEDWIAAVKKLAENKNVFCKISGLYQRSVPQPAPQDPKHYEAVFEVLWENFGKERLIYGSNWPCTKHTDDYASFLKLVDQFITPKGQDARERFYWKNAATAYRLPLR